MIAGLGDARIVFPLLLLLFFPTMITLVISLISIAILVLVNFKGFTFMVLIRWLRGKIIGRVRTARSPIQQRRLYGKASSSGAVRGH
jgi:hypothetical protein